MSSFVIVTSEDNEDNAVAIKATGLYSLEGLLDTLGNALISRISFCRQQCHQRLCQAAEPETFAAKVSVVKNIVFTDATKRELQSLEYGVGSQARCAGSFAATVLHVIGIDEAESITASLQGLLVCVAATVLSV
ncbi:hypothetical protein FAGAP_10752 [Fusarium agapanthi]|uniref:Uncharacterized protein n=1 Tax=Fusarium agapanthi TaxID=1803897 RepID=A0A9P5EA96_9HYPO|nr:hypothetical protein FAGAP_10752 [Fusarium agapanthi]